MKKNLWDLISKSYDKRYSKIYNDIFAILEPVFNYNDEVLEIGCGTGLVSFQIIPKVSKFIGIDISVSMINAAKLKLSENPYENATFIVGDAFNLPDLGQFSKLIMINVIHVIKSPELIIEKCKSLLKKEGELIILSYCHGEKMSKKYALLSLLMRIGSKLKMISKITRFKFDDLHDMVLKSGFKILEEKTFPEEFLFIFLRLQIES